MIAVLARPLLTLMGYDRHVMAKLGWGETGFLALTAALSLWSASLYAVSTGYLAYIAIYSDSTRWLIAGGIGVGVFVFAVTMQRLFVTTGGYAYHWDQERLAQWRPDRMRLGCVFLIAILLSLPYVLLRHHDRLERGVDELRQTKVRFYRNQLHQSRQAQEQALIRTRSLLAAREQALSAPSPADLATTPASFNLVSTNKKALLIGVQHYQQDRPTPGVIDEVQALQQTLRRAGFATTVSLDEPGDKLKLTMDAYLKSLAPGDIGLVYYGGHVLPQAGRNYLVPVDYRQAPGINRYPVTQLIDDLTQAKLQASTVILDAAFWPGSDNVSPLAPVQATPGTLVALRTATAPSSSSRPSDGESLAAALVDHISPTVDVRQALERASADDVKRVARAPHLVQQIRLVYGKGTQPQRSDSSAPPAPAASADDIPDATAVCASNRGSTLQHCLRLQLRVCDAKLAALAQGRLEDAFAVEQYRNSVDRSSMLYDRLKLLLRDPTLAMQIFFVVLVMMAGDLMRDLLVGPLRRYEQQRVNDARNAVESAYAQVRQTVGQMLAHYPTEPLPGLRWHERSRYFGQPSAALLSLGGVSEQPAGSESELRLLLGLPAADHDDAGLGEPVGAGASMGAMV